MRLCSCVTFSSGAAQYSNHAGWHLNFANIVCHVVGGTLWWWPCGGKPSLIRKTLTLGCDKGARRNTFICFSSLAEKKRAQVTKSQFSLKEAKEGCLFFFALSFKLFASNRFKARVLTSCCLGLE